MEEDQENHGPTASTKKKRCRRRRKPRSAKTNKVQPVEKQQTPKKSHDAPMTKRDLYFVLNCELVSIGKGAPAVARVTMINWDAEVVLDTFVQVPVPVTDFRGTGISPEVISTHNPQAMSFAKARQAVQQTLKGKILVGYKLQEHLNSLGLSHPATDVRDAAQFQFFQYEELDGVTHERLVVERALNDLAMEFLQRDLSHPLTSMDKCITALDLYKAYRKEWEDYLVRQAQTNYTKITGPSVPRLSSFDPVSQMPNNTNVSVTSYPRGIDPAQEERGYSWFGMTVNGSSAAFESPESNVAQPILTSEALEMLDYNTYEMSAYERQHSYYGPPSTLYESSSNRGSSSFSEYYDGSSDYSYASESVASSLHEEAPPTFSVPIPEATPSSSWFRFGSRKPRYPLQLAKEPMSSLTEEPDEIGGLTEQNAAVDTQESEAQAVAEEEHKSCEEEVVKENTENEKPSVSWFSFRRPKSPRPSKKLDDPADERDSTPPRHSREKSFTDDSSPEGSRHENSDHVADVEGLNVINSSEILPLESEPGVVEPFYDSGRPEHQVETSSKAMGETEKQSSSWFSFRRTVKPSNNAKDRYEQETTKDLLSESMEQSTVESDPVEVLGEEEDWMREVLGTPTPQSNDELLAIAWPEENAIELVPPNSGAEPPQSTPKESKWLPRFLRYSKSSGTENLARIDGVEPTTSNLWLNQVTVPSRMNQPKVLNPSFFSHEDVGVHYTHASTSITFIPRARLETESTLPTVASEAEDESSHSPNDESGRGSHFIHSVDRNISFSDEEEQKFEKYAKSPSHTSSMEDVGRVLDFVKDMEENLMFLNL